MVYYSGIAQEALFGISIPESSKDITLVVAGDLATGYITGIWLNKLAELYKNVIFVCGNHEFYGENLYTYVDGLRDVVLPKNVFILDDETCVIEDVVFIGSTLWSNAKGADHRSGYAMNDYFQISRTNELGLNETIDVFDTLDCHYSSVGYIYSELSTLKSSPLKKIVVSHHMPSLKMISNQYRDSSLNPFYATNLESIMDMGVDIWICGHSHGAFDEVIGSTRCIRNGRGYPQERIEYNRELIIEV